MKEIAAYRSEESTISARIDTDDKIAFDLFCSQVGLNTSSVLNLFIKKVISEDRKLFLAQKTCKRIYIHCRGIYYLLHQKMLRFCLLNL